MLLESDKEEILKMIRQALVEGLAESQTSITESVKNAIEDAQNSRRLTKEQIMAVKNRTERQRLIQENMDLF